jgi:hypothetical protein
VVAAASAVGRVAEASRGIATSAATDLLGYGIHRIGCRSASGFGGLFDSCSGAIGSVFGGIWFFSTAGCQGHHQCGEKEHAE